MIFDPVQVRLKRVAQESIPSPNLKISSVMNFRMCAFSVVAFGLAAFSARAATTTLYHDDFSGLATSNLVGTTPDITTGGAVWSGSTAFKADGTTTSNNAVYLPITFSTNTTYTFTLTFDLAASSEAAWGALGFATTNTNSSSFNNNTGATHQTMWVRRNGGAAAAAGGGTANQYSGATQSAGTIAVGEGVQMIITVAVGESISSSLLSMDVVGSTGTTTTSLVSGQTIDASSLAYLAISSNTAAFTLQDLLVTATVIPELSSSALLFGGAAAGFVLRRRRKTKPALE